MSDTTRIIAALVFIFFFLISGALGLKTPKDCVATDQDGEPIYADGSGELALCYHEVAVSYASIGNKAAAVSYCEQVEAVQTVYSESQANNCYADIAKLLHDSSVCAKISQSKFENTIAGAQTTKNICEQNAQPQDKKPVCATIFFILLPLLFVLVTQISQSKKPA